MPSAVLENTEVRSEEQVSARGLDPRALQRRVVHYARRDKGRDLKRADMLSVVRLLALAWATSPRIVVGMLRLEHTNATLDLLREDLRRHAEASDAIGCR
jgi:hypothetical protein